MRLNYTTKKIFHIGKIIEYDIENAYENILNVLGYSRIVKEIKSLPKKEKVIRIGLYIKENQNISKDIHNYLQKTLQEFLEENNLNMDDHIISIKKDALFCTKICMNRKINNLKFRDKNSYNIFFQDINKIEYYINTNENIFSIKGINDLIIEKDYEIYKHICYIISLLKNTNRDLLINELKKLNKEENIILPSTIPLRNGFCIKKEALNNSIQDIIDYEQIYIKFYLPVIKNIFNYIL